MTDAGGGAAPGLAKSKERGVNTNKVAPTSLHAAPLTAVTMLGFAGAVAAADMWLRMVLPPGVAMLLPILSGAAGVGLAWTLSNNERDQAAQVSGNLRLARAALELDEIAGARRMPIAMDVPGVGGPGSVIPFPPQAAAGNPGVERAAAELRGYAPFTEILERQMRSVIDLSEAAAGSILANLTGVDARIGALLRFIQHAGSGDQAERVVALIETQVKACRELFDKFAVRQRENALIGMEQRSKIAAEKLAVLDVLEGVNGIARQTTMLSLNVSIEAARAGEAGKGFSIIANEIRKLSSGAQSIATEVQTRVEEMMHKMTVGLQEQTEQRECAEREAIANITETLSALTDNLTTIISHQRDILRKVEHEGEAISQPIMDIMGSIQFQDIIRQKLEQLVRIAAMVDDHVNSISTMLETRDDMWAGDTLPDKLDAMFDGYVMADQRETHLAAQGRCVAAQSGAAIELF